MDHTVIIQNFSYNPASLSIAAGDSVRWENQDGMAHSATRTNPPPFDTGLITPGKTSAPIQFPTPSGPNGLSYACKPHPFMHGTIVVA